MSSAIFGILCAILFALYMIHQELQEMNNRARNLPATKDGSGAK